MTIDEMRKQCPFIGYGNEYAHWKETASYYQYLLDRITTERYASEVGHDWNKWSATLYVALKDRDKLFNKLPKPTKEQTSNIDAPDYPFTVGKWPESDMPAIRSFCKSDAEARKCADNVAAILTRNDYCVKVLKCKTYPSKDWSKL